LYIAFDQIQNTAQVATTDLVINSSLFEPPDLVLALPFTPESNRSTIGSVTVVGQVNVYVGTADEDAVIREWVDVNGLGKLDSPVTIKFTVMANVPPPRALGIDSNDSFAVVECIGDIDIEILVVVNVLDSPAVTVVDKPPLR
jgi:hypothetical protein